jgi:uroporphyrinogen decarboxylase
MTTRELWLSIMHYGEFDRVPVIHWTEWPEARERWIAEGLPPDANEHDYFGAVPMWAGIGANLDIFPLFPEETLEDTPEYRVFRDGSGVVQKDWKTKSCIPHYTDFTLKSGREWPEYKKRLQPDPARLPENLEECIRSVETAGLPIVIGAASMMGWLRNWMGVVNLCTVACEEPDVLFDMVDTISDLVCWQLDEVIPRMTIKPDMGFGWEDICGKNGPILGPAQFQTSVAHGYRKIRACLDKHGVPLYGIDTDGFIEPLLADWFEAGVNVQFPVEIGTWQADPMALRRKFGRELRIIGGIDKLQLEKGSAAIESEIELRVPLMKDGGFIPMPDHLITPDTSLADYKHYLNCMRELRF